MDDLMLKDFMSEADELFNEAENTLLAFEKSKDRKTSFNSIFRCFHSVKGAAGMFGIINLQEHMHVLENIFEKKDPEKITGDEIDFFLAAIDAAKKMLNGQKVEFDYSKNVGDTQIIKVSVDDKNKNNIDDLTLEIKKHIFTNNLSLVYEGHVMVVDDERGILDVIEGILKPKNYKVKSFTSVKEAMLELDLKRPDVVITDIKMPEINGIEFMRKVNKKYPTLPFIIVSGFVTKDLCMEALSAGVMGIIEKPLNADMLLSQLQLAINRYSAYVLFKKSLDMHVSDFEQYDQFLMSNNLSDKREFFRKNLKFLLQKKKNIDSGWTK